MGVVNVTPDSFVRDTRHPDAPDAIASGLRLIREGADVLDVGGESTRPGARPVDAAEETARILPVIQALARSGSIPISVDTYKSAVARMALQAGAQMVNDISGLRFDPGIAAVVQEFGAGVVLSHIRGTPESMHRLAPATDIVTEVVSGLRESIQRALGAGINPEQILLDPGIGFGKTADESLCLLNRLEEIVALGFPVLTGTSRKSFIGKILRQDRAEDRLVGTAATVACCVMRGAAAVRVHDVAAMRQVVDVTDAVLNESIHLRAAEVLTTKSQRHKVPIPDVS